MADIRERGLREPVRVKRRQDRVASDYLFKNGEQFWIHGIGLFESDLTVEHDDDREVRILAVMPLDGAGMADLGAGSGFE